MLNSQVLQIAFGAGEIAIGILVVLGVFRRVAYSLQALILIPGALLLWRYLLDPMGKYLLAPGSNQILFFPSITVGAATLVLLAFLEDDRFSLDDKLRRPAVPA
jgi:uncharacterized membrane protein YphA (DoxX/SURF4 family)